MPSFTLGNVFSLTVHRSPGEREYSLEESQKVLKEYNMEVETVSMKTEEKKVDMSALHEFFVKAQTEYAKAE